MRRWCVTRSPRCRTNSSARCSSGGRRSCLEERTMGCRSSTRSTRFLWTWSSISRTSVGCRRAGAGLAGQVFESNVLAGAELARSLEPDIVVFDGSGAAIPPVATSARVLVAGPQHDLDDYLNPYRVLISDLVVRVGGGA